MQVVARKSTGFDTFEVVWNCMKEIEDIRKLVD